MDYVNDMLFTDIYGLDELKSYKFNEIKKSEHPIDLAMFLPSCLNEFYNYLNNDAVYYTLNLFNFKSYNQIKKDYFAMINDKELYNNKLNIGHIYQGMGYNVSLFYDFDNKCYFFMEQGGSSGIVKEMNMKALSALNNIEGQYKFNTIYECFNVISKVNSRYFDDTRFLQSKFVIKT
jgi:hypothetical protein